jgi:hypothetical protein
MPGSDCIIDFCFRVITLKSHRRAGLLCAKSCGEIQKDSHMVLASQRPRHFIMQRGSMLLVRRVPASAANLRPNGEQNSQELVAAVSVWCSLIMAE